MRTSCLFSMPEFSVPNGSKADKLVGVEIGVSLGSHADGLLKTYPQLELYLVDPYLDYNDREGLIMDMEKTGEEAHKLLDIYGNRAKWIKKLSTDAALDFEDESVDFVYIDGCHLMAEVEKDLRVWYPKVKKGGIFAGHDYGLPEVQHKVNQFLANNNLKLLGGEDDWWLKKE